MLPEQDEAILTRFEAVLIHDGLASSTVVNYLTDLRQFLRWGQAEFGDQFTLNQATQEHIRLYRYYLTQTLKQAVSTVNRRLMALRKFFAFAKDFDAIAVNPTLGVALVQSNGQAYSRPLAEDEAENLLGAAANGSRAGLVRRDVAILQLLLRTGLRVNELINLQRDDLIFDNPGLRLRVSSDQDDKVRYLPLCSEVYKALNDYLAMRPQTSAAQRLFLNQQGQPISDRTVQRIISDCARAARLSGVSAQSLRRTFALQLLAETNDLELVSARLGHQNSAITAQYLAVHEKLENRD
jgi:site-specific recombinase XerD